jgi:hypothetical protein
VPDLFSFQKFEYIVREISAMSSVIGMGRGAPQAKALAGPEQPGADQILADTAECAEVNPSKADVTDVGE